MKNPENVKRGRNSKKRGSVVEREVARLVGGQRIFAGMPYGDVATNSTIYEVKSRQAGTPKLIAGAWEQATKSAELTQLDPAVVLSYVDNGKRTYWVVTKLEG